MCRNRFKKYWVHGPLFDLSILTQTPHITWRFHPSSTWKLRRLCLQKKVEVELRTPYSAASVRSKNRTASSKTFLSVQSEMAYTANNAILT